MKMGGAILRDLAGLNVDTRGAFRRLTLHEADVVGRRGRA